MLSNKDKERVLKLIEKVKKSKSIEEIREIELEMKEIDFNNRKMDVVKDILDRMRANEVILNKNQIS